MLKLRNRLLGLLPRQLWRDALQLCRTKWLDMSPRARIITLIGATALMLTTPAIFIVRHFADTWTLEVCPEYNVPVRAGDTLAALLSNYEVPSAEIAQIDKTLRKDAKFRSLSATKDTLQIWKQPDSPAERIVLNCGPWRQIHLTRNPAAGTWDAKIYETQPEVRLVKKSGVIKSGDSFYTAGSRTNIPPAILIAMYDLFSFEIDFERDVRAGQKFHVLYEEFYQNGKLMSPGNILFAEFDTLRGNTRMYRFTGSDNRTGYYGATGLGAIKSLKRTPINNAKVTSSFSMGRKHPVLGFTRAHRGVDFRASTGTPIPASGAGRVVRRGYDGGYGNFIQLKHGGSFETLYGHMSRFAPGVNVGTYVRQGQTIGYVGSTGLSTGPHLHYEIIQNGMKVNPMSVKLPAINNLAGKDLENFLIERARLDSLL
ncbi:MAG: M23 family metallopeptidase [Rickettsiales bacterium]|nr:M23 family metallopeptidase [Rickettsiales bacterium]